MDVVVTGIGLLSGLGDLSQTWSRLLQGKTAIAVQQPFSELSPLPLALLERHPTALRSLTAQILQATLTDANLQPALTDCAVVIGSSRSHQAAWEQICSQDPSFSHHRILDLLPSQPSSFVAQTIQTQAIALAPMAACATGVWAIAQACELIRTGQAKRVIAGAVEAPVSRLAIAGFERMGALAQTGCYPFDQQRQGLVLGEGGAFLVLETADLARDRQAKIYGQILSYGLTSDAHHFSAPDPLGQGAKRAVQQCLANSQLASHEIDFIHTHGTATQLNDRQEAALIQQLFHRSSARSADPYLSSTKGATGHTLGASGALGVALALMALRSQILPPCTGLNQPDFDLNFVRSAIQTSVRHILCCSFGFGGQNAAIALQAAPT
jgi:3-oxoacyl-[acyl-carrier-protein] synthase II